MGSTDNDTKFDDHLLFSIREGDNEEVQSILEKLNPCELIDNSGTTLLHISADCGNAVVTKYLIDRGCKVDVVDNLGNTPLILACKSDHLDVIIILLEEKTSVLINNNYEESAAKIVLGDPIMRYEIFDMFLEKVKEECSNDSLQTAEELLKLGCILPRSVILRDAVVTKYMLENGCAVDERDEDGPQFTALLQSVAFSDIENVKVLIEWGADVNAEDRTGRRPLSLISDQEILEILLDNGAQLVTDDGTLVTGHLFQYWGKETVNMLMKYNPDLAARDQDGCSLFSYLVLNEKFDPVDILKDKIDDSFDIDERDYVGLTGLMHASGVGNSETVEFLLKMGAQVNTENRYGSTPLCYALFPSKNKTQQKARTKIMTLLLQHGADVQWISNNNSTLLDDSLAHGNFVMAKLIIAQLAVMEVLGCEINDLIYTKIDNVVMFKKYFDFCKKEIEKLKRTMISRRVSLFDFLTVSEKTLIRFARNEKLVLLVQKFMYHKRRSNLYYYRVLRQRVVKAIQIRNLRKIAFDMVSEVRQLHNNQIVMEKIVDYLISDNLKIIVSSPTFMIYNAIKSS